MPEYLDNLIALGLVSRFEGLLSGVGSTMSAYIGVTTGPDEVVVLGRSYGSSGSSITIALYELAYTSGNDARRLNRRLSSNKPAPCTIKVGVTPSGSLPAIITATTIRAGTSTGVASIQVSGDESQLYLKANTSYVVGVTNNHGSAADIGFAFDLRAVNLGESLERQP